MTDSKRAAAPDHRAASSASPAWVQWLLKPLAWLIGLAAAGVLGGLALAALALAVAYPNLP